jgi:DNA-binding transcriptional ArsR family regulator
MEDAPMMPRSIETAALSEAEGPALSEAEGVEIRPLQRALPAVSPSNPPAPSSSSFSCSSSLPPACPEHVERVEGPRPEPACGEPVEPVEAPPPPPTRFSSDQRDELDAVHEAARWSVRRDLLVELGLAAARGEPVEPIHVAALAERVGIDQNTVSRHLRPLKDAGYVSRRRQGRNVYYTADPARVRVDCGPAGLSLTLIHPSGAYVTHGVPMPPPPPPPAAEPPQVIDPPRAAEPAGGAGRLPPPP